MEINEAQNKIKEFDNARGWKDDWDIKDLLLNITEEGGELWDLIKWVNEEKQKEVLKKKKDEASDYIGDTLFLLLKMANQMGVNVEQGLKNTLKEYEKRMPPEIMKKVKHANKNAGGIDNKNGNSKL